jgi:nucleoside 2-deoxyribosyltransferase
MKIYLIGSLRNSKVPIMAELLRDQGYEVFDDWYSPGPETDEKWQEYEKARGRTFIEALAGYHAQDVFHFDKTHLDQADVAVLLLPAGKSCHLELGYMIGQGKPAYIVLDTEPDRFDVMYAFATEVVNNVDTLLEVLDEREMG